MDIPIFQNQQLQQVIDPEKNPEYQRDIENGRAKMARSSVVFCGLARNNEISLQKTIPKIEQTGSEFSDYRVVIFENDSTDDTRELLLQWQARNPRVIILSETFGHPIHPTSRCPLRGDRMAHYRNLYLNYLRENYATSDYAIVIDTDLAGGWSINGIANTFGHDHWDFVASNGVISKRYLFSEKSFQYDAWAYRTSGSFDPLTTKCVNRYTWQRGDQFIPVSSAFGGLGVYRMAPFIQSQYGGGDCEHVALHRRMSESGSHRLFLNPSQEVYYGQKQSRLYALYDRAKMKMENVLRTGKLQSE